MLNSILLIIQIIILIAILLKLFATKNETSEKFLTAISVLNDSVDCYYALILKDKISSMRLQFDLDPSSKTYAGEAFSNRYNDILKEVAKDLIKNHLSKSCLTSLLGYYTIDSLVLTIISKLKQKVI